MPLDPQARTLLDQMAASGAPPLETLPVAEAREQARGIAQMSGLCEPMARIENHRVPVAGGEIAARVYVPTAGQWPLPVLVYLHGGGWVLWDLDAYDAIASGLARRIPAVVVSIDYRLAPEHKFPTAVEDAYAATRWVAANASALGGDSSRIAMGGDSAGGNLTAAAALMARDRGGPALVHQMLIYPATDAAADTPSLRENGDGYLLTAATMGWFWGHYLRGPGDRTNPYASPLRAADHRGLPPAFILTAEYDPLRDEGEAYGVRLRAAGVPATVRRFDGMIHGFLSLALVLPQAAIALDECAAAARAAFAA